MSSDNPTADRLVSDARKKTAAQENPRLAQIGLAAGALGLISVLALMATDISNTLVHPLLGWVLGAAGVALGGSSLKNTGSAKLARIALVLGVLAILLATFFFTLRIALHGGY
jgi:hypothetical protein